MNENINLMFIHILILYRNAVNYNKGVGIMWMHYLQLLQNIQFDVFIYLRYREILY